MEIQTPSNINITGNNFNGSMQWNPNFSGKWSGRFSNAQKYVDSEVLRLSEPYLPFQIGILKKSGILATNIGSGTVEYNDIKARYLYNGKVMVGPAPKQVTDIDLVYTGGPMRGAFWFERMKIDHKDNILEGAGKIAGGST